MTKTINATILCLMVLAAGCSKIDDFLGEPPSKTSAMEIERIEQLEQILNGYQPSMSGVPSAGFSAEDNNTAIYSTDDYFLDKQLYDAQPGNFNMTGIQYTMWDTDILPRNLTTDRFWTNEYRKVFYANTVLEYLDKVTGGTAEQKANLKADAHLVRAYSYWVLANTYCLPYSEATKNEPGLPIKLTINFEEEEARQPLHKVYEQIESDLAEALKTTVSLVQSGRPVHWRASKAGVHGFAARYWLNRYDYAKALEHADAALSAYSTLVDYNTEMRYGQPRTVTLNAGTPQQSTYTIQYPYAHNNQLDFTDMIGWKEFLYFRMLSHGAWWYIPSPELLALYDQQHDLRYRYHVVEGYSYDRGMLKPSYNYPGYVFFFKDRVPSGPTVAEMLLIKAEALAHAGSAGPAMVALNQLRAKRMEPGAWVNLTATGKDDAIKKVADERRRELPFSQRWYDLRRYNHNAYEGDDVTLTRSFYPYTITNVSTGQPLKTYTLEKGSRRWAAPIPNTDITASRGVLEQNKY